MSAVLETISTGDEIARGRSVDTNAPWIARRAAEAGVLRRRHQAVGDDPEALAAAFLDAGARSDFVVVTGGLGPTEDDYTRRAAAAAGGVGLVHIEALWVQIRERYRSRGREIPEANRVQASIPEGSEPIENPLGTAPGFRMTLGRGTVFFLSGVPREMELMFERHVLPEIRRAGAGAAYESIATFGRPEVEVNERLKDVLLDPGLSAGLTADFGTIRVTLQATGAGAADRVAAASAEVRRRLDDLVLEAGTLEESVLSLLGERGLALATAESCTGGLVGKLLTDVPGSSAVYRGSVVAYANAVKESVLGVPADVLAAHGAVSAPVAAAMAEGARRLLGADVAVSITGIAGPDGGTEEKPVGLVWFGVAGPDGTETAKRLLPGDRAFVRRFAANVALGLVRRGLRKP